MIKKILLFLFVLSAPCFGSTWNPYHSYSANDTVTNTNLNGNFNSLGNILNGGLDNTNANTASGYRFFQTVGTLPAFGNQGAVYFLTSGNTLNFDTGSSFVQTLTVPASAVQGNTLYYGVSGWTTLAPGTTGFPLVTGGSGANPSWGEITAASTVSGAALTSLSSTPSGAGIIPAANLPFAASSQNVVTGSRSISSIYQNTTGRTMFVLVNINGSGAASGITDSSANPSTTVVSINSGSGINFLCFMVLPNNYYKVLNPGSGSLSSWIEWY